ncbi:MAG: MCP four helix bundle domain-containing protein [Bryobacterales bacterium]|nr:MCP four helix bundle domain-containing protein [Bryobacterales bacterium]
MSDLAKSNASTLTVTAKIGFLVGSLVLAIALLSLVSFRAIHSLSGDLNEMAQVTSRKAQLAGSLAEELSTLSAARRAAMLQAMLSDAARVAQFKAQWAEAERKVLSLMDDLHKMETTESERQQLRQANDSLDKMIQLSRSMAEKLDSQQIDAAVKLQTEQLNPAQQVIRADMVKFATSQRQTMERSVEQTQSSATWNQWIVAFFVAMSVIGGIVSLFLLKRVRDEFRTVATRLARDAMQVATAAGRVRSASKLLAQGASEQAASLEETSASVEEINSMTKQNAHSSQSAAQLSQSATSLLAAANQKFEQMKSSMNDINQSSEKISRIIHVIDEIAFQTNILALNAAVEAARAGEAGMGFAVVADEVRNLAQRSAQAAKDTSALIEDSIRSSRDGRDRVNELVDSMRVVTENTTQSNELNAQVNASSEQQAHGISQISQTILQMQNVTSQTAANAEETAAAGEEMAELSNGLQVSIDHFHEMVGHESGLDNELQTARSH